MAVKALPALTFSLGLVTGNILTGIAEAGGRKQALEKRREIKKSGR